ncbi:MAG: phospho-N-acetylmuramoyl-pentapeptide-transferase [Oscillospiraceae bacterium]
MERIAVTVAAVVAFLITWGSGYFIIPVLRKIKFGQTINEIGPKWHKAKQGTPTMGGFTFILGASLAVLAAYPFLSALVSQAGQSDLGLLIFGIFTAMAFSAVGFIDDYLKVVRKQNLGLKAMSKIVMQALITICFLATLYLMGRLSTFVMLPFAGSVNFGLLFYPLAFLLIIFVVNAVNLTDGLDGLATAVTFWVMVGYAVVLVLLQRFEILLWPAALAGGCVGFLLWNLYPAKVFMGDTGSMFFGGAVATLGFCMGAPELVVIFGVVYILEALSVVIQVTYFKLTHGKRLFKMTPIHHHFELMGWSEKKIVFVFSSVSFLCAVAGIAYAYWVL